MKSFIGAEIIPKYTQLSMLKFKHNMQKILLKIIIGICWKYYAYYSVYIQ